LPTSGYRASPSMSSQTGKELPRGDASPLQFDALVDAWLGVLADRRGRGPSSAQQVRLRQHLAVLRRVATETSCGDGDGHGLTVDIGAGVLPLAQSSVDELAERLVDAGYPFATHQQIVRTLSPASRMGPPERVERQEHGTSPAPVMGPLRRQ
jgi:hypothetical protein